MTINCGPGQYGTVFSQFKITPETIRRGAIVHRYAKSSFKPLSLSSRLCKSSNAFKDSHFLLPSAGLSIVCNRVSPSGLEKRGCHAEVLYFAHRMWPDCFSFLPGHRLN